nr:hypothetical protein [uncultured Hyphomonas sp.]
MATTYYFIAEPGDTSVMDWFRTHDSCPMEMQHQDGLTLFFKDFGRLAVGPDGDIDPTRSPLVSLFPPGVRRRALWTVGEVHFLTRNLPTTFAGLEHIRRRFQSWLKTHPVAWERKWASEPDHSYPFEGEILGLADRIYGFPSGLAALEGGRYFVTHGDNDLTLDKIARKLRLRGVDCS